MFWFLNAFEKDPEEAILQLLIVVFSICCHEYMHARTALWQGDDTAAIMGHLTLNPLKQMGPISILMLLMVGIAFGQVPVDPRRMRHSWSEAVVSLAGPLTNLALFTLFLGGAIITSTYLGDYSQAHGVYVLAERDYFLYTILLYGAMLNLILFLFNLVPVPPLDGYGVLCYFFPKLKQTSSEFVKGAILFIFIALFASAQYLLCASSFVIWHTLKLFNAFAVS